MEEQKDRYDLLYEEYDKAMFRWLEYAESQYAKAVFYISTGSLAISITFVEKFVDVKNIICPILLFTAWVLEVATILFYIISQYISKKSIQALIEEQLKGDDKHFKKSERLRKSVKIINIISVITLISGLLLLVIFVYINLLRHE